MRPRGGAPGRLALIGVAMLLACSIPSIHAVVPPMAAPPGPGLEARAVAAPSALNYAARSLGDWNPLSGRSAPGIPTYRLSTLSRASASCSQSYSTPAWLAYDGADQSLWVATPPSCLDEYTPASSTGALELSAVVPVGVDPFGVAVDNRTNDIFVTNTASDNVTVVSGSTDSVIANISVGGEPYGVAYDWASNEIYVANGGTANVTVISGTTLRAVGSAAVGSRPIGVVADPAAGKVFVADSWSAEVSVLSDATDTTLATVATGNGSYGVALDNTTGEVYVTNEGANNFSVVNGSTDTVVAAVPTAAPFVDLQGVAYDPTTGLVWAGGGPSYAVVVNASSNTLLGYAGTDPSGAVFDPANGDVCVTNTGNMTLECVSFQQIGSRATPLVFQENGLPAGAPWEVDLNFSVGGNATVEESTLPNITFGLLPSWGWDYEFEVVGSGPYVADPASGSEMTTDAPAVIPIQFAPAAGRYPVTFSETGLPAGTTWAVDVGGTANRSTSRTIVFWEPNGTYSYTLGSVPGFFASYVGSFQVVGAPAAANVSWLRAYAFTLSETGLPTGSNWSVSLNEGSAGDQFASSTGASVVFALPNGSGRYQVTPIPGETTAPWSSTFTIDGGPLSLVIAWRPFAYPVAFAETGLLSGAIWTVTINGAEQSAAAGTLSFSEPNGSYRFNVTSPTDYSASPASGTLAVQGGGATRDIMFSLATTPLSVEFTYPHPAGCTGPFNVTFTSTVSGGTPPYSYRWEFGDGSPVSTLSDPTHLFSEDEATSTVTLTVTDSGGDSANRSTQLEVDRPAMCGVSTPTTGSSSYPILAFALVAAIVIVVSVAIVVLFPKRPG